MAQSSPELVSGRLIEWTGERCVPWTHDAQVIYEHYHRYLIAAPLVRGKRVLDLASGEGYGAALLAQTAAETIGAEVDAASVAHAQQRYRQPGLSFVQISMLDLSQFADASVDVITCFEALEHVAEHKLVLSEIRRVLAPDGLLLMSTPDRLQYTEHLHQENHFHVRELSLVEFRDLLEGVFPNVHLWGQSVAVGSLIQRIGTDAGGSDAEVIALGRDDDGWSTRSNYPPTYAVALASASPAPVLPSQSLLVDVDLELVREAQRQTQAHVQGLAETRELLAHRDAELQRRDEDIAVLSAAVQDLEARAVRLQERLAQTEEALQSALVAGEVANRNSLAARAETEQLRSSVGMRLLARYQKALDQAVPVGSRRRQVYLRARRIVYSGTTPPSVVREP